MNLVLIRHNPGKESTVGILFLEKANKKTEFWAYTCEDEYREIKVAGLTRVPAGQYLLALNTEGNMNVRYRERYGDKHHGMLELMDVPGFTHVYIHTGNNHFHTSGCILIGYGASTDPHLKGGEIQQSRQAYVHVYHEVVRNIQRGEQVTLSIYDSIHSYFEDLS